MKALWILYITCAAIATISFILLFTALVVAIVQHFG